MGQLVNHVLDAIAQFSRVAAGGEFDPSARVMATSGNALAQCQRVVAESLGKWGEPGALDQAYAMPFGEERGERLAAYLIIETVGHAWDIAIATGSELAAGDDVLGAVLQVARSFSEETLRAPGMFGPEQVAPEGASAQIRLAAFLGRSA